MPAQTNLHDTPIPEGSVALLSFVVNDEEGNAIAGTSLDTLTVTLYNDRNEAIINGRSGTDILGANGGSVDGSGNGEWLMDELDNVMVQTGLPYEDHTAEFTWTYSSGTKTGRHRVGLRVANFVKVT
jgi:hypothetical protein